MIKIINNKRIIRPIFFMQTRITDLPVHSALNCVSKEFTSAIHANEDLPLHSIVYLRKNNSKYYYVIKNKLFKKTWFFYNTVLTIHVLCFVFSNRITTKKLLFWHQTFKRLCRIQKEKLDIACKVLQSYFVAVLIPWLTWYQMAKAKNLASEKI